MMKINNQDLSIKERILDSYNRENNLYKEEEIL